MTLLDTQRGFRDHILAGTDAPLPGAPERGLAVYRHAYRAQLVASLRDTFEKTWTWLGDDAFDKAARQYVEAHAPKSWTLNEYGDEFVRTLRALYPGDAEVAELAWLDWHLRRAFDGPDGDAITPEALGQVDWDHAVLIFVPTLTMGEVATNCAAIWGALANNETPPAAQRLAVPATIRIWRSGLTPKYRTIETFEQRALTLAMAGSGFADLCALLVEDGDADRAAQDVGAALASWLRDGLIRAARTP
ncbi:MAG: putative DNA-binding domain-containing protein [Alphaproteobacteria bacterium]|nr:putative DNA-binding domain-containing protein [Alphaproteobacteria bacterium]